MQKAYLNGASALLRYLFDDHLTEEFRRLLGHRSVRRNAVGSTSIRTHNQPNLEEDPLLLAVIDQHMACEMRVAFALVDGRLVLCILPELIDMAILEVRNADGTGLAFVCKEVIR